MRLDAALWEPRALSPADVLERAEYLRVRASWMQRMLATKRARRVALGDRLTVVFETRDTVLWQIHEVLHIENGWSPARIERELEAYRGLVAGPGEVCATVFVDGGPPGFAEELATELAAGRGLGLRVDGRRVAAKLSDSRAQASCPVRYVRFAVGANAGAEWELWARTPTFLAACRVNPASSAATS